MAYLVQVLWGLNEWMHVKHRQLPAQSKCSVPAESWYDGDNFQKVYSVLKCFQVFFQIMVKEELGKFGSGVCMYQLHNGFFNKWVRTYSHECCPFKCTNHHGVFSNAWKFRSHCWFLCHFFRRPRSGKSSRKESWGLSWGAIWGPNKVQKKPWE